jgi:hypothetical protein
VKPLELVRRGWLGLGAFAAAATAAAALGYALSTAAWRPVDGTEAMLLFTADRVRAGLPLFVDPLVGAFDYGPVPSRFYALYTPLWPAAVAAVPAAAARATARLVASACWFGSLAAVARRAPARTRLACCTFAGFAGGSYFLLRSAAVAAPDASAAALATWGLMRVVRRGRLDSLASCLFVAAALVKPNVFGMGAGVLCTHLAAGRRAIGWAWLAPIVAAAALLGLSVSAFQLASQGAWFAHLLGASAQEIRLTRWLTQVPSRLPFLGLPQVLAGVAAVRFGRANRFALAALATSTAWTTFSMAKSGSTTNYWFEPTLAALAVLATTEPRSSGVRDTDPFARAVSIGASALAVVSATVALPAIARANRSAYRVARALVEVRTACARGPGEMTVAPDPGIEYELTARLAVAAVEITSDLRRGHFPLGLWSADLALPQVRWFVTWGPVLDRALPKDEEGRKETGAFLVELRPQIDREFEFDRQIDQFWVYRRRRGVKPPG